MAKISKNTKAKKETKAAAPRKSADPRALWSMSHAPSLDEDSSKLQILPAVFFTAFIILIVRMVSYTRPMDQFFWSAGKTDIIDFFSYGKMIALLACAGLTALVLVFRVCTQSLTIKRSYAYIPMAVYCVFVLLSYLTSDYKDFSLLGYNDRFEGTLPLLAYMLMLFFIINTVNGERSVRWILYGLVLSSVILSVLGISQALGMDFFRTTLGQKLLVPNYTMEGGLKAWNAIDAAAEQGELFLEFSFNQKEIYQTVYNINYVSFYLTLLVPLFGMLFIRSFNAGKEEAVWKKAGWAVMFALTVFNLIGSVSSGGLMGMTAVVAFALILLNVRIKNWWKPVLILIIIACIIAGVTVDRWLPEVMRSTNSVASAASSSSEPVKLKKAYIDSIITGENYVDVTMNGETFSIVVKEEDGQVKSMVLEDLEGNRIAMKPTADKGVYSVDDDRFRDYATVAYTSNEGTFYVVLGTYDKDWHFPITEDGVLYRNGFGNWVQLHDIPAIGFENNQRFGSGRGYIWSRTFPMMKDTVLLGHGADTYTLYFPHEDYVGKYNSGTFRDNVDIIVDKPHNMYMGAWIGTGGISVIALLALWGIYLVQSMKLYFKHDFADNSLLSFAGVGIMFGIFGFLVAGLVNDSTVSVMPMFYGLLGCGISINMMLSRKEMQTPADAE